VASDVIRCFVAIELPKGIKESITSVQDILKQNSPPVVRWVNPEGIHLTLKFLGNVSSHKISDIGEALTSLAAHHAPFHLLLGKVGAFPGVSRPRVLWIGVDGDVASLQALEEAVDSSLHRLGFAKEGRQFTAHLTLGRLKEGTPPGGMKALSSAISSSQWNGGQAFVARGLSLMQSDLTPKGAVYTRIIYLPFSS